MVDFTDLFGNENTEAEVEEEVVAPVVEAAPAPVAVQSPAPVVSSVQALTASADEWEVAPGVWQIVTPVTGAFTLPDGTWVRPTEIDGVSRAAVPAAWVEYVRALKG